MNPNNTTKDHPPVQLRKFRQLNGGRRLEPTISIDFKTGQFRLNREAVELLGVEAGDRIAWYDNPKKEGVWYIYPKDQTPDGLKLRKEISTPVSLKTNSCRLAGRIAASMAFTGRSGVVIIGGTITLNGLEVYTIITDQLRND